MHPALLNKIFAGKVVEAFCWMLVHSLWQGLLFTIITGLVMMLTKKSRAVLRYNIMAGLFFLFMSLCAGTFIWQLGIAGAAQGILQTAGQAATGQNSMQLLFSSISSYFSANAPLIVMVWFAVFVAKCVKMAANIVYSQRVRHHKIQQPPAYWKNRIEALCNQLQITQKVQLLQSGIVKIPVVIGHLKPIVLIPVGLLTNLPAGEVEAVLLHELAHIRRNDYFVNIIQVVAENIFFFNPALLWMSSLLREEREHCCDDVAVAQTKSKKQFIQALISFKEHALHTNNYTTAFPAKKNQLLLRATRIINNRNKTLNTAEKVFFTVSLLVLSLLLLAVNGNNAAAGTKNVTAAAAGTPAPATTAIQVAKATVDNIRHYTIDEAKAKPGHAGKAKTNNTAAQNEARPKPYVYEYSSVVITGNKEAEVPPVPAKIDVKQPAVKPLTAEQKQGELDREQADRDREQAERDRKQAELDRIQAGRDRDQAAKDQQQADLDRQQAVRDRQQAEVDRQQAEKVKTDDPAKKAPL